MYYYLQHALLISANVSKNVKIAALAKNVAVNNCHFFVTGILNAYGVYIMMKCILSQENDLCSRHIPEPHRTSALNIKKAIKDHKWIEGEKGRRLTWHQASMEWFDLQPDFKKGWLELQFSLESYMLADE